MPLSITALKDGLDAGSRRHGGPADRGSADRYYGRPYDPHYFVGASYQTSRVGLEGMTRSEIAEYTHAFNSETDRKDWGWGDWRIEDDDGTEED